MRRGHGGDQPSRHREQRGRSDHSFHRRVRFRFGRAGRPVGEAPGGDEPRQHPVRGEAAHRPPDHRRRGAARHRDGPVPDRQGGQQRRRLGGGRRTQDVSARDLRPRAHEDEEDGGRLSRGGGRGGGHHRARVLQRLPAPGDEGRGPDRGARGAAHHQRADRRGARLRDGQEAGGRPDRGLRPRRRHLRHLDYRDRGGGGRAPVRGALHQRGHLPRGRGLRSPNHGLPRRRVPEVVRDRPAQRPPRPAAPEGGGGEDQDRALLQPTDRGQPALHHRRCERAEASQHPPHPGQARGPGGGTHRPHDQALRDRAQGREAQRGRDLGRDPGRRPDPHAEGAGGRAGHLRARAAPGREPGRGGRDGGRDPGGRACGGRQGRPPARRHPPCRSGSRPSAG